MLYQLTISPVSSASLPVTETKLNLKSIFAGNNGSFVIQRSGIQIVDCYGIAVVINFHPQTRTTKHET